MHRFFADLRRVQTINYLPCNGRCETLAHGSSQQLLSEDPRPQGNCSRTRRCRKRQREGIFVVQAVPPGSSVLNGKGDSKGIGGGNALSLDVEPQRIDVASLGNIACLPIGYTAGLDQLFRLFRIDYPRNPAFLNLLPHEFQSFEILVFGHFQHLILVTVEPGFSIKSCIY